MIDRFTSWLEAVPIPNKTAPVVAEAFVKNWVCRFGVPDQLYIDQGHEVSGQLIKRMCRYLGIEKIRTTPYHPQADGKAERAIQQIKRGLRLASASFGGDWEERLPFVLLNLRTCESSSSGFTPAYLTYGRELVMPHEALHNVPSHTPINHDEFSLQLLENLHSAHQASRTNYNQAQIRQKRHYDARAQGDAIVVGEWVLVRRQREYSLDPELYEGPFKVCQKLGETQFVIQPACDRSGRQLDQSLPPRQRTVHFDRLFKVRAPQSYRLRARVHDRCRNRCPCRVDETRDRGTQMNSEIPTEGEVLAYDSDDSEETIPCIAHEDSDWDVEVIPSNFSDNSDEDGP